jgi:phosphoribosylformimino-5-aminoimidazole carboxamide ribotide isomerase
LYIADLDAIQGRGDHGAAIDALHAEFPQLELWIDPGVRDSGSLTQWTQRDGARVVLGTESMADVNAGQALLRAAAARRCILSLDFRGDGYCGPPEMLARPELWPPDVIGMTLGRVGSAAGPDLQTVATLLHRAGERKLYAAGGVRDGADLEALRELGVQGVLVATALHDGRIGSREIHSVATSA